MSSPFPEFDDVPLGHLPARIASLDRPQLAELVEYERAHGNRLPVLQVLEHRLDQLANGAEPSSTPPTESAASLNAPGGGSKVSPVTTGPPQNPPHDGDPKVKQQPKT